MPYLIVAAAIMLAAWFLLGRFVTRFSSRVLCLAALAGLLILVPYTGQVPGSAAARPDNSKADIDLAVPLLTLEGKRVSLADDKGKVLFLNFWATWCGPCRAEMPSMAELYELLKKDGLSMVAVTEEPREMVVRYLERHPYPFTIMIDPSGELTRRLRVIGLPTTFVLDEDRRVIYSHIGPAEWDTPSVVDLFREALGE
jgi:thiol-disulfide isomerase/thioredoxin